MDELVRDVHVERYYPGILAPAKEFKVIAEVENPEFNLLWRRVWQLFCNTFVYDIDEDGATRWEAMLKIRPKVSDDLETRRRHILSKINLQLPYTYRRLIEMLAAIYGENMIDLLLNFNQYELRADVAYTLLQRAKEIKAYLRCVTPANMSVVLQNSKYFSQNIYVGTYLRKIRMYTIESNKEFGDLTIASKPSTGAYVRKARIYMIGG